MKLISVEELCLLTPEEILARKIDKNTFLLGYDENGVAIVFSMKEAEE